MDMTLTSSRHESAEFLAYIHITREASATVRSTTMGNAKASERENGQASTALTLFLFYLT